MCFQFSLVVSAGVFHNQIAAGLWTEKPRSKRQLFFSAAAKTSGPVLELQTALTQAVSREPSSQDTDMLPLASNISQCPNVPGAASAQYELQQVLRIFNISASLMEMIIRRNANI